MHEIVIAHPELNTTWEKYYRRYSYTPTDRKEFSERMAGIGITPTTHPVAVDLCAGDGSYAQMLVENGWKAANITCIDVHQSPTPIVEGVSWRYWNLYTLDHILEDGNIELPEDVLSLKGSFDLAIMQGAEFIHPYKICGFFVRSGGYFYNKSWVHTQDGKEVPLSKTE